MISTKEARIILEHIEGVQNINWNKQNELTLAIIEGMYEIEEHRRTSKISYHQEGYVLS